LPRRFAPALEHDQRGNASNAIARGDIGDRFGVELRKSQTGLELGRCALEMWRHRPARPAPIRPEIDDDGDVVAGNMLVERGGGQLDRMPVEQGILAGSAHGRFRKPRGDDSIDRVAGGANDVQTIVHDYLRLDDI
jgi:hypothetical protein